MMTVKLLCIDWCSTQPLSLLKMIINIFRNYVKLPQLTFGQRQELQEKHSTFRGNTDTTTSYST